MSQLVVEQSQLKHELEEMTVPVSNKDAEIALLKAQMKNGSLLAQNVDLQEKPIKAHDMANDRFTLIQSLIQRPPSS
ncbi:hypothetical protein KY290_024431 [Solanum tuberosum]|uniref:Uncharacterized protein n=1 Tax=Solanum tuberosum TaxID=4113 RepID=A0ABQ7USQ6_SOLTU|nr:hypothetical protein KY290_024431 [Solanum tuberosum]